MIYINQIDDWHLKTQNNEYLELSKKRLKEPPLFWVNQFTELINLNLNYLKIKKIKLNDIGCNVGHFPRNLNLIKSEVDYIGVDISETYIGIARQNFTNLNFVVEDFSQEKLDINKFKCDISIVSATLEHIENYDIFLKNIFESTSKNVIIRTFIGENSKKDYCLKDGATSEYLIRQFSINDLVGKPFNQNWSYEIIEDRATKSLKKEVCKNIERQQFVLNFLCDK